jgi:hypothetical protein
MESDVTWFLVQRWHSWSPEEVPFVTSVLNGSCPHWLMIVNHRLLSKEVIFGWPLLSQSFLVLDPFRTHDLILVLFKTFICFEMGASCLKRGGVGLSVTTLSKTVICCWPLPAQSFWVLGLVGTHDHIFLFHDWLSHETDWSHYVLSVL